MMYKSKEYKINNFNLFILPDEMIQNGHQLLNPQIIFIIDSQNIYLEIKLNIDHQLSKPSYFGDKFIICL